MAARVQSGDVAVVMTDVRDPACMVARFIGQDAEYVADIEVGFDWVLPVDGHLGAEDIVDDESELPAGAVVAATGWRVSLPEAPAPGLYRLLFYDRCLNRTQQVVEVTLGNPVLTVHGRTGHVVAEPYDYAASQVASTVPGVRMDQVFSALGVAVASRVLVAGDLEGSPSAPEVGAIRGRAVQEDEPEDGAELAWSAANNRWEGS